MRSRWLLIALVLSALLAALHLWALDSYLYWYHEWFDVLMHYLGGLAIGVFLVGFIIRFKPAFYMLAFVAIVVGWEIFEYVFGIPRETNYVFDTSLDFLMDALGALTAYALARFSLWR